MLKYLSSEIINDSVFDFLHEFSSPFNFCVGDFLFFCVANLCLMDAVFLEYDSLHCRLMLFFCKLLLSLFLFFATDLLPLFHQTSFPVLLRLLFSLFSDRLWLALLDYRFRLLLLLYLISRWLFVFFALFQRRKRLHLSIISPFNWRQLLWFARRFLFWLGRRRNTLLNI